MTASQGQEHGAGHTDRDPEPGPAHQLHDCFAEVGATDGFGGHRPCDEEVDERRGNAVVETALHVDQPPDARGDSFVRHDGRAESGIGRGHDGTDGGGHPESAAVEEERGRGGAGPDGEGEANAQEARRKCGVGPQGPHIDPGCVGEEHEGECHLGQSSDRRGVQAEMDDVRRAVGDDHAEHDERHGGRDVPALEARRDQAPDDHAGRDHGEGGDVEVVVHGPGAIVDGSSAPRSGPKVTNQVPILPRTNLEAARATVTVAPGGSSQRFSEMRARHCGCRARYSPTTDNKECCRCLPPTTRSSTPS